MKIPSQYLPVMPYIIVQDAPGFLKFAKLVFGATQQLIVPGETESQPIMHAEIKIHEAVIMFAQATPQYEEKTCGMFIYVEDVDKVYQNALDHAAQSLAKPIKQDYGYTAGFQDPFGNQWWIIQGEK